MAGPQSGHDFFAAALSAAIAGCQIGTRTQTVALILHQGAVPALLANEDGGSAMNWDQIEGNWMKAKGKLRQQWGKLTDDDLSLIDGKREELASRLQERYGYQKEQAEKEIDSWMRKAS
jgi:uncharacterized protein YjbJ (UPF0337 family)